METISQIVCWLDTNAGRLGVMASIVTIVAIVFHIIRWIWRTIFSRSIAATGKGGIVNKESLNAEHSINQAGRDLTINNTRSSLDAETITQQNKTIVFLQTKIRAYESTPIAARASERLLDQVELAVRDLRSAADATGIDHEIVKEAEEALAQGATARAEFLWQQILDKRLASAASINREAAAAARNLGILVFSNDTQAAIEYYRKSVELDPTNPDGINQLGQLLIRIGEAENAEKVYLNLLSLAEDIEDKSTAAIAIGNLGIAYEMLGNIQKSESNFLRALELYRELGDRGGMASCYGNLSDVKRRSGQFSDALKLLSEAKKLYKDVGNLDGTTNVEVSEAAILVSLGQFEEANNLYQKSIQYFISTMQRDNEAKQRANIGNLLILWRRPLALARAEYEESFKIFESLDNRTGIALASLGISRTYLGAGQYQDADQYAQQSLTLYREIKIPLGVADALAILANIRINQADDKGAEKYSNESILIYQALSHSERIASMYVLEAEIARFRLKNDLYRTHLSEARDLYKQIGSPVERQIQQLVEEFDNKK